jgi:hypothetical protein
MQQQLKEIRFFDDNGQLTTSAMIQSLRDETAPDVVRKMHMCIPKARNSAAEIVYLPEFHTYAVSDEQVAELTGWLDEVSPGWRGSLDAHGNPVVQITEYVEQGYVATVRPQGANCGQVISRHRSHEAACKKAANQNWEVYALHKLASRA